MHEGPYCCNLPMFSEVKIKKLNCGKSTLEYKQAVHTCFKCKESWITKEDMLKSIELVSIWLQSLEE